MLDCATPPEPPRPLPPVMTPENEFDLAFVGISARAVTGTDAVTPSGVLSWTEALTSPGWAGSGVLTVTVLLSPAARTSFDGLTLPYEVNADDVTEYWIVPLNPDDLDSAKMAVHVPNPGK